MITATKPRRRTAANPAAGPRPDDFRRLGVAPREARLDIIRQATGEASEPWMQRDVRNDPHANGHLAKIAASAYRLLDPRLREPIDERVQLVFAEPLPIARQSSLLLNETIAPPSAAEEQLSTLEEQAVIGRSTSTRAIVIAVGCALAFAIPFAIVAIAIS
jgi:hypothetical protein